jgi:hypothetical protein
MEQDSSSISQVVAPGPDEIATKDERNKAIRSLASRNGYIALTAGVLLMSAHELARSGRVGMLIIPVGFSLVSILFLIIRRVHLRILYQLDERGRQLIAKSFSYAIVLVLLGNILYLAYLLFTYLSFDPNRSITALLICLVSQQFAFATVEATLILKNASTSYSLLTYWVNVGTVLMITIASSLLDLLVHGLFLFFVNPGWLFTAATIYISIMIVRHRTEDT